jgi:hypothetical protein
MVARREALGVEVPGNPDLLEHDVVVLTAFGCLLGGDVGDRHHQVAVCAVGLRLHYLRVSHLGGEDLRALEQILLLVPLHLRDLLAQRLLLRPETLITSDRGPPVLVCRESFVDHVAGQTALGLGGSHTVGVFSQKSGIDHPARVSAATGHTWRLSVHPIRGAPCPTTPARGLAWSSGRP